MRARTHTHIYIHTQKLVPKVIQYRRPQKENFPATPQAPQGDHPLQTQMRYSFCPLQFGTSTEERLPTLASWEEIRIELQETLDFSPRRNTHFKISDFFFLLTKSDQRCFNPMQLIYADPPYPIFSASRLFSLLIEFTRFTKSFKY